MATYFETTGTVPTVTFNDFYDVNGVPMVLIHPQRVYVDGVYLIEDLYDSADFMTAYNNGEIVVSSDSGTTLDLNSIQAGSILGVSVSTTPPKLTDQSSVGLSVDIKFTKSMTFNGNNEVKNIGNFIPEVFKPDVVNVSSNGAMKLDTTYSFIALKSGDVKFEVYVPFKFPANYIIRRFRIRTLVSVNDGPYEIVWGNSSKFTKYRTPIITADFTHMMSVKSGDKVKIAPLFEVESKYKSKFYAIAMASGTKIHATFLEN